jgi:hypothetical protein
MKIQNEVGTMKLCNIIFFSLIGVCLAGMVYANIKPDKTEYHTSTVSGTSGELNCTGSSCVVKEK